MMDKIIAVGLMQEINGDNSCYFVRIRSDKLVQRWYRNISPLSYVRLVLTLPITYNYIEDKIIVWTFKKPGEKVP